MKFGSICDDCLRPYLADFWAAPFWCNACRTAHLDWELRHYRQRWIQGAPV